LLFQEKFLRKIIFLIKKREKVNIHNHRQDNNSGRYNHNLTTSLTPFMFSKSVPHWQYGFDIYRH
jgi:hypothetical protein